MTRTLNSDLLTLNSPYHALWGLLNMPRKRSRVRSAPMVHVVHHLDGLFYYSTTLSVLQMARNGREIVLGAPIKLSTLVNTKDVCSSRRPDPGCPCVSALPICLFQCSGPSHTKTSAQLWRIKTTCVSDFRIKNLVVSVGTVMTKISPSSR